MPRRNVLLSWSSGKDSAWTLHVLRQDPEIEVVGLLTTVNQQFDRVSMHAVRRSLLEQQARVTGLPPWIVEIPYPCSNEQYESAMGRVVERARNSGVSAIAFGDLFLQDVREYRESRLADTQIEPLFPLWLEGTAELAVAMLSGGLKARVTCIDPNVLDPSLAGREWDREFLDELPEGADPCGENGEFHTFVYDGPMFSRAIAIDRGEVVRRDGFVFADLVEGRRHRRSTE